jgi:gluconate kinase
VDCVTPLGEGCGVASVRMTRDAEILSSFAVGDELRLQADSCRQLAGLARTERNRLVWLRLANEWLDLANSAERHKALSKVAL